MKDVDGILRRLSLQKYSALFREQEIDFDAFVELSDSDLVEIGIKKIVERRKILEEIRRLEPRQ